MMTPISVSKCDCHKEIQFAISQTESAWIFKGNTILYFRTEERKPFQLFKLYWQQVPIGWM